MRRADPATQGALVAVSMDGSGSGGALGWRFGGAESITSCSIKQARAISAFFPDKYVLIAADDPAIDVQIAFNDFVGGREAEYRLRRRTWQVPQLPIISICSISSSQTNLAPVPPPTARHVAT